MVVNVAVWQPEWVKPYCHHLTLWILLLRDPARPELNAMADLLTATDNEAHEREQCVGYVMFGEWQLPLPDPFYL